MSALSDCLDRLHKGTRSEFALPDEVQDRLIKIASDKRRALDRRKEHPSNEVKGARAAVQAWLDATRGDMEGAELRKGAMEHGLALVKQGITDFAEWSVEMIKKFGEAIRDYLKDVWAAATKTSRSGAVQLGGTVDKSGTTDGMAPEAAPFPESNRLSNIDRKGSTWAAITRENPTLKALPKKVTVYRATVGDAIRANDYVAANRQVAEEHLQNLQDRGEKGRVVAMEVAIEDLLMANDATEFVYAPSTKGFTNTQLPRREGGFVNLPPQLAGAMEHGADLIRQGITDFAKWSAAMLRKFGEAIRAYLTDVWAAARKTSQSGMVQLGGTVDRQATDTDAGGGLPPGERAPEEGDQTKTRKFGARVAEDARMNPRVQAQAAQQYVPIENVETLAQANAIIDQMGLENASAAVRDAGSPMPPHVRVALGMQIMLRLDQAARAARNAGDLAGAAAMWQQTGEISNYVDTLGTEAGRAVQAFAMWTKLTPEGVLTTFEKKVREVNGGAMPTLPAEMLTKLGDLRDKINALPEGSPLRADLMRELMSELALYQGIPLSSIFASLWYANLLSGITTQGMNVVGNGFGLFLRSVAAGMASHPSDTIRMIAGYLKGLPRAWSEAKAALRGKVSSRNANDTPTVDDVTKRNALEVILDRPPSDWKSWLAWIGSAWSITKYVGRTMTGMDALFYYTAAEGRAHLAASRAARQGFTPGTPEFVQAMASQLGLGAGAWDAALQEGERQLRLARKPVTLADKQRIAYKIIEDSRPPEIKQEAQRFGEIVTSQQEPDGFGKWVYDGIRHFQRLPLLGRALLPFARTLANLASNAADFTPVGVIRGIKGKHLMNGAVEFSSAERKERAMAGALGTAVFGFILAKAWDNKDEDDETTDFMIYAGGPLSKARRDQMPKGWKPYTVKIGKHYWSYAETPLVYALAPAGAIMDSKRYHKNMDDRSLGDRTQYYVQAVLKTGMSQGVLSSMGDFMGTLNGDVPLSKLPSRFTSGAIPGQGFLRDVTGLYDPVKISDDTVLASMLRDVPVLRRMAGRPALDYMGDPITYDGLSRIPVLKRFVADQRSEDKDKAWAGKMRLSIPAFPKLIEVGDYLTKGERASYKMARANAGEHTFLTPEEQYKFVKRAGQMTRERVKAMRLTYEEAQRRGTPVASVESYQKSLDARVTAARKIAMRELMMR